MAPTLRTFRYQNALLGRPRSMTMINNNGDDKIVTINI